MNDSARIGDVVTVDFGGSVTLSGEVKHMPAGPGDAWVIHTPDGYIYHVQQYETICVQNRRAGQ